MDNALISTAADAIIRYLTSRPMAADTIEGIHCYWIEWDNDDPEMLAVTEAALLHLEKIGFIERRSVGGKNIWRRVSIDDSRSN